MSDLLALLECHDVGFRSSQRDQQVISSNNGAGGGQLSQLPVLTGPRTLPFHFVATQSTLHTSNVLLVRSIQLLSRQFNAQTSDGGEPRFKVTAREAVVSAGADKRVLILDASDGVLGKIEPVTRTTEAGHTAAVLDVAQHPLEKRELITAGMDGKVIVWDLLARRPCLALHDHRRFVVHCAWSIHGRYLATAGHDRYIHVYEREAAKTRAPIEDRDMDEVVDLAPLQSS